MSGLFNFFKACDTIPDQTLKAGVALESLRSCIIPSRVNRVNTSTYVFCEGGCKVCRIIKAIVHSKLKSLIVFSKRKEDLSVVCVKCQQFEFASVGVRPFGRLGPLTGLRQCLPEVPWKTLLLSVFQLHLCPVHLPF